MNPARQNHHRTDPAASPPSLATGAALPWVLFERVYHSLAGPVPPRAAHETRSFGLDVNPHIPPEWQLNLPLRSLDSLPLTDSPAVANFKRGRRLILACDGGGILGIITLHCLSCLEQYVGAPVVEIFDLFAGTSTGAIIASALAAGVTVADLIRLYTDKRSLIFSPTFFHSGLFRLLGRYNLVIPKYHKEPIRAMLQSVFGDLTLAQLPRDIFITAKDTVRGETTFFTAFHDPADRHDAKAWAQNAHGTYKDVLLRAAVEASMSAPTYFEPLGRFVDGGVGAYNNTCYASAVEALRYSKNRYPKANVGVYSFGTGSSLGGVPSGEAERMSIVDWAQYVIGVGMNDANKQQVYVANNELCAQEQAVEFRRYQFYFTDEGLQALGVPRPLELDREAEIPLDAIELFDFLNTVGVRYGNYLHDQNLFDPSIPAQVQELGRPANILPGSYIEEIKSELAHAVA